MPLLGGEGRLVLVQAVLSNFHSYWAAIFVLPTKVIKGIENACRNYLWEGSEEYSRSPLVSWEHVCKEKQFGGLGIRNARLGNVAMLGKYVWWMASKSYHLWIQWIHHVYLRRQNLKDYEGYKWLMGVQNQVQWKVMVWSKINDRLLTGVRQCRLGFGQNQTCYLCADGDEDVEHLFFQSRVTTLYVQAIQSWLGMRIIGTQWQTIYRFWVRSGIRRLVLIASVAALVYHIWFARNICRLYGYVQHYNQIRDRIRFEIRAKIRTCVSNLVSKDVNWLECKHLL
ncbi:hypothetical protein RND81_02G128900 [Saponaria officinalis]|uniref:Reverse transcriptase zinc-binding domain-containing protein n=1 Tax=Saponaria officinalis TaxID=3572 RepID=A0AAW1MMH9_SAPOF